MHLKAEDIEHSILGASGAYRWMNCPGTINLGKMVDPELHRKSGQAATLGTAAHTLASKCLEEEMDTFAFIGEKIEVENFSYTVDANMADAVQMYVDFCNKKFDQFKDAGAEMYVELPMASKRHEKAFSTTDCCIVVPEDRLIIIDYKHGEGVVVEPTSPQPRYYGYLAYETFRRKGPFKVIELWIVQPRIPHPDGFVRRSIVSAKELSSWFVKEVIPAMNRTEDPAAELQVGDWCTFCPVKDFCPALKSETVSLKVDVEPVYLDNAELGALLKRSKAVKQYLDSLETEAFNRVMKNQKVPGYKLVEKQSARIFKPGAAKAAKKRYGPDAFTKPRLKGLGEIEKLPKGGMFLARWCYKPNGGYTIAPVGDKRREVTRSPDELFGDAVDLLGKLDI